MNTGAEIQSRAWAKVRGAIMRGELRRPDKCERCNTAPRRGKDGRSCLHAHHEDYAQPLSVQWICAKCHRAITPMQMGEEHWKSKLDKLRLMAAADLVALGWNYTDIGSLFGVDRTAIAKALNGVNWLKAREQCP